ncbi:MAG TPA: type IV toxin-antitoxin system AbiEi family antitoxin [Thermoplasmata archaeon]|nr:type IV toxin-antitoxin system AbiEi family antitoxin [Thermoplasmata archaeon]
MKNITSTYIIRRLAELQVTSFRDEEFSRLFGLTRTRGYQVLHRLVGSGLLHRIARGRYVVGGPGEGTALGQPFFLATRIVEPSYVGFWSALAYYGWTEQAPRVIFVATTRRSGRKVMGAVSVRFVRLRPSRFFGYAAVRQGNLEFPMAEPEKAIVDSLLLPEHSGGMELVASALREALPGLDRSKLESYAMRTGVRSLASRLGYLLERSGIASESLRPASSSVYVKLDPRGPRRGCYDSRWRVLDNLPEAA